LRQCFETKHSDVKHNYSGEFKKQKAISLVQTLKDQQIFLKSSNFSEQVSFEVAHLIIKSLRLFIEGDSVKNC